MLSEDLASLAVHLRKYGHMPAWSLQPEAVDAICAVIDSCAEDARSLERLTAPPAGRVTEISGNVVPMTRA